MCPNSMEPCPTKNPVCCMLLAFPDGRYESNIDWIAERVYARPTVQIPLKTEKVDLANGSFRSGTGWVGSGSGLVRIG